METRDAIGTMWALPTVRFGRVWAFLDHWLAVRRSRNALGRLDDHLLRDIGLTRADALREARRLDLDEI